MPSQQVSPHLEHRPLPQWQVYGQTSRRCALECEPAINENIILLFKYTTSQFSLIGDSKRYLIGLKSLFVQNLGILTTQGEKDNYHQYVIPMSDFTQIHTSMSHHSEIVRSLIFWSSQSNAECMSLSTDWHHTVLRKITVAAVATWTEEWFHATCWACPSANNLLYFLVDFSISLRRDTFQKCINIY